MLRAATWAPVVLVEIRVACLAPVIRARARDGQRRGVCSCLGHGRGRRSGRGHGRGRLDQPPAAHLAPAPGVARGRRRCGRGNVALAGGGRCSVAVGQGDDVDGGCALDAGVKIPRRGCVGQGLVGRWAKGEEGAPCPPLLPGSQCDRYDSFVDDVDHPTIFVVPHSTQACPVYVITYRC